MSRRVAAAETSAKDERLEARITSEKKEILQRAAAIKGVSLSDFVVATAYDEAARTIEAHEVIRLSLRDSALFLKALDRPSPATAATKRRFKRAVEGRRLS